MGKKSSDIAGLAFGLVFMGMFVAIGVSDLSNRKVQLFGYVFALFLALVGVLSIKYEKIGRTILNHLKGEKKND
jgi:hypothetical protein